MRVEGEQRSGRETPHRFVVHLHPFPVPPLRIPRNPHAVQATQFRQKRVLCALPFPGLECLEGASVAEMLLQELPEQALMGAGRGEVR